MAFALQDKAVYTKNSLKDVIQQNLNENGFNLNIQQSDLEKVLPSRQAMELATLYRNYKTANAGSTRIFLRFLVKNSFSILLSFH